MAEYEAKPLPVYKNNKYVHPPNVVEALQNATVEVHFELKHYAIQNDNETFDSFTADIQQIIVMKDGIDTGSSSPYKRKSLIDGPYRPKGFNTASTSPPSSPTPASKTNKTHTNTTSSATDAITPFKSTISTELQPVTNTSKSTSGSSPLSATRIAKTTKKKTRDTATDKDLMTLSDLPATPKPQSVTDNSDLESQSPASLESSPAPTSKSTKMKTRITAAAEDGATPPKLATTSKRPDASGSAPSAGTESQSSTVDARITPRLSTRSTTIKVATNINPEEVDDSASTFEKEPDVPLAANTRSTPASSRRSNTSGGSGKK